MSDTADPWAPGLDATPETRATTAAAPTAPGALPDVVEVLTEVLQDARDNLVGYLLSGVGVMVLAVGIVVAVMVLFIAGAIVPAVLTQVLGMPAELGTVLTLLAMLATYVLAIFGIVLVTAPMSASIARAVLAHQRGEAPLGVTASFSDLFTDLGQVLLLTLISGVLSFVGMLFCYVPALLVSLALGFAFPAIIVHRKGAIAAITLSFQHVRDHFQWHLGYWGLGLAILFIGQAIPLVGPMLSLPVYYGYQLKMYTLLYGDGAPEPSAA